MKRNHWPAIVPFITLLGVEILLVLMNVKPGTFLMGWDNVMPELNFKANIVRSLVGVWQENRGLGLFDGMSHVANLVHTIFLWILSFVLPINLLRYFFTFLMHALGGIGIYLLIQHLFGRKDIKHNALALIGALFYLFNLATIQMFYTPLEAFSVHFASLPWIALTFMRYLKTGTRKDLFFYLAVLVLSTPQFFVTTLLFPIIFIHTCIAGIYIFRSSIAQKRCLITIVCFILINAFWLLPFLYGAPQNAPTIQNAKINQMSSEELFARNRAFGDARNVLLLRGFSLDYTDLLKGGTLGFMMNTWREHINNPISLGIAYVFIVITLIGFSTTVIRTVLRKPIPTHLLSFTILWLMGFVFLANDTPIIGDLTAFIRSLVPFLGEALRIPFTKFSLLFAFSSSILFIYGLEVVCLFHSPRIKYIASIVIFAIIIGQVYLTVPAFQGNFFYTPLRVTLPQDYLNLSGFMQTFPSSKRVTILPQHEYWSWKHYGWGYRGSGFLWHLFPQPLLDQAFDPWSGENENYFWEISYAIYKKDPVALDTVFSKYDVSYVLFDKSIISTSTNRSLYKDEISEMLSNIPTLTMLASFGKISLYERKNIDSKSFISVNNNLPIVMPAYKWTDNDRAFSDLEDYITYPPTSDVRTSFTSEVYTYPFRALFTKRSINEREFHISEDNDLLTIASKNTATSSSILKNTTLVFDSLITHVLDGSAVSVCAPYRSGTASGNNVREGQESYLDFISKNQRGCLSFGMPDLSHKQGYIIAVESKHERGRPLLFSLINQTAKHVELETYLPTNSEWQTSYFILPPLASDGLGYSVYISNDSIGNHESINNLKRIRVYQIPYDELVSMRIVNSQPQGTITGLSVNPSLSVDVKVDHPNPAYYKISFKPSTFSNQPDNTTLVLSQAYNDGWKAYNISEKCKVKSVKCSIAEALPFLFGREINDHVLVNNWTNGWRIKSQKSAVQSEKSKTKDTFPSSLSTSDSSVIVLFFLPQILEWVGFMLLPIPFLCLKSRKRQ